MLGFLRNLSCSIDVRLIVFFYADWILICLVFGTKLCEESIEKPPVLLFSLAFCFLLNVQVLFVCLTSQILILVLLCLTSPVIYVTVSKLHLYSL